jgi:hypothetical protein
VCYLHNQEDIQIALLIRGSCLAEGRLDYPNRAHLVDHDRPRTSRFQRFRSAGLPQQRAVDGTTSSINYSTYIVLRNRPA